jgi:adenosylmethionine-8-amino-7-oxononanoate aminotransferase
VALENLAIFREEGVLTRLQNQIVLLKTLLERELKPLPNVYEVRHIGFLAGIELRHPDGAPFAPELGIGAKVCRAARGFGLLTRPIRDTVVLMPPYCITDAQLAQAVGAIAAALRSCC